MRLDVVRGKQGLDNDGRPCLIVVDADTGERLVGVTGVRVKYLHSSPDPSTGPIGVLELTVTVISPTSNFPDFAPTPTPPRFDMMSCTPEEREDAKRRGKLYRADRQWKTLFASLPKYTPPEPQKRWWQFWR